MYGVFEDLNESRIMIRGYIEHEQGRGSHVGINLVTFLHPKIYIIRYRWIDNSKRFVPVPHLESFKWDDRENSIRITKEWSQCISDWLLPDEIVVGVFFNNKEFERMGNYHPKWMQIYSRILGEIAHFSVPSDGDYSLPEALDRIYLQLHYLIYEANRKSCEFGFTP